MLTAYDAGQAALVDEAGIDVILVGDSVANVVHGYETTLPISLEEMITHCRAVARGRSRALLVGDMPFLSYQVSVSEAVRNAGRLLKEGLCDAVKLEGGEEMAETVAGALQGYKIIMQRGHGCFSIGETLEDAYQWVSALEEVSDIILRHKLLDEPLIEYRKHSDSYSKW